MRGQAFAATQGDRAPRATGDYRAMIEGERGRPDRIDAVADLPQYTHLLSPRRSLGGIRRHLRETLTTTLEDAIALEEDRHMAASWG